MDLTKEKVYGIDEYTNSKVIPVIETITKEGDGTEENPVRLLKSYWTLDGKLIGFTTF